jgi:RNA polymerase sigma-70 factor (ECF subfamily)
MAIGESPSVDKHLQTLFNAGVVGGWTDTQLVERFVSRQEGGETAFAVLVARYGPMVLRVCRRTLGNSHDAEDALQATFLVLALKARSLRQPDRLANWLYGVAYRIAAKAKAGAGRRRAHEQRRMEMVREAVPPEDRPELLEILDEEIHRLPGKYRLPIVLCYVNGLSHDEAARQLGCPVGTVESWLSRARERLRSRLSRRGFSLSTGLLGSVLMRQAPTSSASFPPVWVDSAASVAMQATGSTGLVAGVVSAPIVSMAQGVFGEMLVTKMKIVATLTLLALGAGAGVLASRVPHAGPAHDGLAGTIRAAGDGQNPADPVPDEKRIQGTWLGVGGKEQGKDAPEDAIKDLKVVFSGDKVTVNRPAGERKGTFKLDPSRKPRTIDMTFDVQGRMATVRGVYEFDGERLKICLSESGEERPADLDDAKGSLRTLRREG